MHLLPLQLWASESRHVGKGSVLGYESRWIGILFLELNLCERGAGFGNAWCLHSVDGLYNPGILKKCPPPAPAIPDQPFITRWAGDQFSQIKDHDSVSRGHTLRLAKHLQSTARARWTLRGQA